jgi:putative addiction module antidote
MLQVTVRKVGNSLGMILPAEAVRELNLSEGDRLFLTKSPEGLRLTPYDPSFEKKMEIARKGMRKYRNALRELAK